MLSVVYVFIDAKRRGVSAYWGWGLIALIPFVGLIAYLALRPNSYLADREEQELDIALRERHSPSTGPARSAAGPSRRISWSAMCNTQVRNVCPSCHRPLDAHWKVCPYCRTHIQ